MNSDNWLSLERSAWKMVGAVLMTVGVFDATTLGTIGPLLDSVTTGAGAVVTLVGLFKSFWHHSP